jgi:hypothetical protein
MARMQFSLKAAHQHVKVKYKNTNKMIKVLILFHIEKETHHWTTSWVTST